MPTPLDLKWLAFLKVPRSHVRDPAAAGRAAGGRTHRHPARAGRARRPAIYDADNELLGIKTTFMDVARHGQGVWGVVITMEEDKPGT